MIESAFKRPFKEVINVPSPNRGQILKIFQCIFTYEATNTVALYETECPSP